MDIAGISLVYLIILPLSLSFLGTLGMRYLARRLGIIDVPNKRKTHIEPTPRGGGMAIAATFLFLFSFSPLFIEIKTTHYWGILVGGLAIAILGFVDDLVTLRRTPRIITWLGITVFMYLLGIKINSITIPVFGVLHFGFLSPVITFIWLIGVTNFYNFMDGINGLTGFESLIVSGFLAAIAYLAGNLVVFLTAGLLFGCVLGFLPHNFPRAKIFLGDGGSNFLGFVIAASSVIGAQASAMNIPLLVPFILSSLFILDAGFALIRHLPKGKDWLEPHLNHYFQRLIKLGYSHTNVTLFYAALNLLLGVLALMYFHAEGIASLILLILAFGPISLIIVIVNVMEKRTQG